MPRERKTIPTRSESRARRNMLANRVQRAIDRNERYNFRNFTDTMYLVVAINNWINRIEAASSKVDYDIKTSKVSVLHTLIATANQIEGESSVAQELLQEISQIGREIHRSRVKEGIDRALAQGKRLGRPSIYNSKTRTIVERLRAEGKSMRQIAKESGIPTGSVQRLLAKRDHDA